jgi:hypothetical protein
MRENKSNKLKNIVIVVAAFILILFGLFYVRYDESPKHYSEDGQYSFYSKRSVFDASIMSMPGDGDTGRGTIYVFDEIAEKEIYQFESSWLRSDMEASGFSEVDGGMFICKSGYSFVLPRPLNTSKQTNELKKLKDNAQNSNPLGV